MSNNLLSRRSMLKLLGISAVGLHFTPEYLTTAAHQHLQGRALAAVPVHTAPSPAAPIRQHLWPDSEVKIISQQSGWYRTTEGYVQQAYLQPMQPPEITTEPLLPTPPFWALVAGSVATVHQWCAADAPLITRIGHGGTANVVDYLAPGWYGLLNDDKSWLGWTQAASWQPVDTRPAPPPISRLLLDHQTFTLTGYAKDRAILRAPIAIGATLQPGQYAINQGRVSSRVQIGSDIYHGAPWQLDIADLGWISGVYWHNRFGQPVDGPTVQINTYLARWLYGYNGIVQVV